MPGCNALQILKLVAQLLQPLVDHRMPRLAFACWLEHSMVCRRQARPLPVPADCSSPCHTARGHMACLWLLPMPAQPGWLAHPGCGCSSLVCGGGAASEVNSASELALQQPLTPPVCRSLERLAGWCSASASPPELTRPACACHVQQPGSASRMVPLGSKARQQGEGDPFAWTPPPTHGAQQHPPGAGLKAHRPAGQQPHHQHPPKLGAKRLGTGGAPGDCPVTLSCRVAALPSCI